MSSLVEVRSDAVHAALRRVTEAAVDLDPVLRSIGEDLAVMIKRTFETSSDPEGVPWARNSEATLMALLNRSSGSWRKKDGKISAKGTRLMMGKKPLIGESTGIKALSSTIFYQVGDGALVVASPREYAAMQQFGGKKSQFPHLWGDIPPRPFFPITPDGGLMPVAERAAVSAVEEILNRAIGD